MPLRIVKVNKARTALAWDTSMIVKVPEIDPVVDGEDSQIRSLGGGRIKKKGEPKLPLV
jgi:hypothetical protein